MAANDDSPRSPPLNEQVPNIQRFGIEILFKSEILHKRSREVGHPNAAV